MDNLEQEWNRCMLTGLVHALPLRHADAGTTIAFALRAQTNAACTLSTGGVLVCIFIKKQCFVLILPTFQLAICLL